MLAVDRLGQNLGAGGLAGAPGAGEEVGVGEAVLGGLTAEGIGDMGLSDHVGEGFGPPFAVQGLVHGKAPPEKRDRKTMEDSPQASAPNRRPRGTCCPA